MIFYKAIKYTILDYCIDKIFNQLTRNLSTPKDLGLGLPLELTDIYHGLTVSRIIIQTDTRYGDYHNCMFYDIIYNMDKKTYNLTFSFGREGTSDWGLEMAIFNDLQPNQIWVYS